MYQIMLSLRCHLILHFSSLSQHFKSTKSIIFKKKKRRKIDWKEESHNWEPFRSSVTINWKITPVLDNWPKMYLGGYLRFCTRQDHDVLFHLHLGECEAALNTDAGIILPYCLNVPGHTMEMISVSWMDNIWHPFFYMESLLPDSYLLCLDGAQNCP